MINPLAILAHSEAVSGVKSLIYLFAKFVTRQKYPTFAINIHQMKKFLIL
jgi:hypothetical protein